MEVRFPEDLVQVERLIIPGGESTTVGLLLQRFGLTQILCQRAKEGMPIWGTCMGMILMARAIQDRPQQESLNFLDIEVQRNAFGSQIHSFEANLGVVGFTDPFVGVFIRAPIVTKQGHNVKTLCSYEGKVVAVQQNRLLGTSFHPELTNDTRFHELFLHL